MAPPKKSKTVGDHLSNVPLVGGILSGASDFVGETLGLQDAGRDQQHASEQAWYDLEQNPAMGPRSPVEQMDSWWDTGGRDEAFRALDAGRITEEQFNAMAQGHVTPQELGLTHRDPWDETLQLDRFDVGRQYDPATEQFHDPGTTQWKRTQSVDPGASAWGDIDWDRAGAGAQRSAMDYVAGELSQPIERRTAAAEAEWERQRGIADQQSRAHREAALSDLELRGMGGGGAALGAALAGEQDRTMSRHGAGLDYLSIVDAMEAQERGRRDQLATAGADIGSRYDASQFGQAGDTARGQDAFTQWTSNMEQDFRMRQADAADKHNVTRAGMQQDVTGRNVDRTNEGSQYNINRERDVADANVGAQHTEEAHRATLPGTWFDRNVTTTAGKTNQLNLGAEAQRKRAGTLRDTAGGIAKAVGLGGAK